MPQRILTALAALAAISAAGVPAEAQRGGYWQLQPGSATIVYGPRDSNEREWMAQGTNVLVKEASPSGALITMTSKPAGDINTITYRAEWKPPRQVIPGEVIGLTASSTVLGVNYVRPQFPINFDVAVCQWIGLGGPVYLTELRTIPAKSAGQSFTSTNDSVRARTPDPGTDPGTARLKCGLALGFGSGLNGTFQYAWVRGAAPVAGTPVAAPAATPAPASPGESSAGEWGVDFNGSKGTMELTPASGGWRGRFDLGGGWEQMENLRISGTSITFDRVNGGQHYEGQLGPAGFSGTFTYAGRPYRWTAKRAVQAGPPPAGSGSPVSGAGAGGERVLFFNGNVSGVTNGGKAAPVTFSAAVTVTRVMTYHWNEGRGPGRGGFVMLLHESGTIYGPWPAPTANNVYWEARPNAQLPAGRYQVIDSDPATWAQNGQSQGFGHVRISGY